MLLSNPEHHVRFPGLLTPKPRMSLRTTRSKPSTQRSSCQGGLNPSLALNAGCNRILCAEILDALRHLPLFTFRKAFPKLWMQRGSSPSRLGRRASPTTRSSDVQTQASGCCLSPDTLLPVTRVLLAEKVSIKDVFRPAFGQGQGLPVDPQVCIPKSSWHGRDPPS